MSKVYTSVSRVASWAGWCSPCGQEDRPLVLTRSGPGGTAAWLKGLGDDDRILLLTCRVCGEWQFVPAREEDDPEIFLVEDDEDALVSEDVRQVVAGIVAEARTAPTAALPPRVRIPDEDRSYDALATAEPVLSLPTPAPLSLPGPREDADIDVPLVAPSAADTDVDVDWAPTHAPVEAPVAAVPAPRPPVPRIVTVPEPVTLPAFSPEAVEAAARVLTAARSQTPEGSAPHRTRPTRTAPAPRTGRTATVRLLTAADAPALPAVLGLPAGTRSVVLAAAS